MERLSVDIIDGSANKEDKHQVEVLKQKGPIFCNALGLIWLRVTTTCMKSFPLWNDQGQLTERLPRLCILAVRVTSP